MSCSLGEFSTTMRRRAWKTRGKRGSALNKGMPIYDQMSGWRVKLEPNPYKTWDFRPCGFGESPDEAPLVKELFATYLVTEGRDSGEVRKEDDIELDPFRREEPDRHTPGANLGGERIRREPPVGIQEEIEKIEVRDDQGLEIFASC